MNFPFIKIIYNTVEYSEEDDYENCSNTDSTADLPKHIIEKYQIPVAPLSVTFDDGETFTEHPDLSKESFIKMAASKTIPTTSQPAIGEWIRTMRN